MHQRKPMCVTACADSAVIRVAIVLVVGIATFVQYVQIPDVAAETEIIERCAVSCCFADELFLPLPLIV
jgi:hypothetical protein